MYISLNIKTDYDLQKSLIKVKDLINFCVHNNIKVCGICDPNLFGSIEFYKLCVSNNIKPIIGLEITIANKVIYLYAKNYDGYKDLLKINSNIYDVELTLEDIKNYLNNVLVIVPCQYVEIYDELKEFTNDIYIGISEKEEKEQFSNYKTIYNKEIRCFQKEDIKYLNILYNLSGFIDLPDQSCFLEFIDENISEFINQIDIEIPFDKRYIPKYNNNFDSAEYLTKLAYLGLDKRLNGNIPEVYKTRLKYELDVIKKMGFVDYFLIVYDYVSFAKKNGILVGPGRGSAAGSLVSYVIGITNIDPIKYDLLFERFLNMGRVTMPDIDIDFDSEKREEVISYVKEKYGKNNVSGGMTYATYKTRLVLRDVAKYLGIEETLLNKFLNVLDRNQNLVENSKNEVVKKYLTEYEELRNLYDICIKFEGLKKNISTHAAGIVISDRALDEIIPMYYKDDLMLTGVPMEYLENMGLLKMDFLALKNLTTIANITSKIPDFNINEINLEDNKVYELFSSGNTDGIFQFETPSFKSVLPKLKPQNFNDLIAAVALVRPGPSKELETYIKRKNGQEKVAYYDESLKDILKSTYGVIVYQEQVILILNKMASFNHSEADNIRRAMSKKKKELLENIEEEFINRSIKNGYSKEVSQEVYNHILEFASYGFNKSHSVSYALISYQMAYLKTHYKYLFVFELLNDLKGNNNLVVKYLNEIKQDNIKIIKPSWNFSDYTYRITNKFLYLPYKMINGLSKDKILDIINERKNGTFQDIYDVFKRTSDFLDKKNYELLIKADMFKEFKYNNQTLLNNLENLMNYGTLANLDNSIVKPDIEEFPEMSSENLRQNELNIYGFYISNHPASKFISQEFTKLENIDKFLFQKVKVTVIIERVKKIKTKKGEDMAFLVGSDDTSSIDFTVFPKVLRNSNIKINDFVIITGEVSKRFDKVMIVVNDIKEVV